MCVCVCVFLYAHNDSKMGSHALKDHSRSTLSISFKSNRTCLITQYVSKNKTSLNEAGPANWQQ